MCPELKGVSARLCQSLLETRAVPKLWNFFSVTRRVPKKLGYACQMISSQWPPYSVKPHHNITHLDVNKGLILWMRELLSCRPPQRVCVSGNMSDVLTESRPQRCLPSPVLFSRAPNGFSINEIDFKLIKQADYTALIGPLKALWDPGATPVNS